MATREEILAELQRRGVQAPQTPDREAIRAELARRGVSVPGEQPTESSPSDDEAQAKNWRGLMGKAVQGATFGFGDELMAGASAPVLSALSQFTDNPRGIGQMYGEARDLMRADMAKAQEENPLISAGSELAGGVLTGRAAYNAGKAILGASAPSAVPKALNAFAKARPKTAGALAATGSGGLYGFGAGEGGLGERAGDAAVSGLISAPLGFAGGALAQRAARKNNPALLKEVGTSKDLRRKASSLYKEAQEIGGRMSPKATKKLLAEVYGEVSSDNRIKQAFAKNSVVRKKMDEFGIEIQDGISFDELRELEKLLGDWANDNVNGTTGAFTSEGNQFFNAQQALRKFVNDLPEDEFEGGKLAHQLKRQADKIWSQSHKMAQVENVINRAELMDQPSTSMRTGLRGILANPKKARGYSDTELATMRKAAELDTTTSALRTLGSRLIPTLAASGSALSGFNPASLAGTAAAYGGSALARRGADMRQFAKAQGLLRLLENPDVLNVSADPLRTYTSGIAGGILGNQFAGE